VRVQSGAAIFQATGNGDSLQRGTGSLWIAGDISPVGLFSGYEHIAPRIKNAMSVKPSSLVN
jgi:hypothetical protein